MYSSNNNIGKLLRRCIEFIFDELFRKQYVSVEDIGQFVDKKHLKLYIQTVKDLKRNIGVLEKSCESGKRRNLYLEEIVEDTNARLEVVNEKIVLMEIDKIAVIDERKQLDEYIKFIQDEKNTDADYVLNKRRMDLITKHTKNLYVYLESVDTVLLSKLSKIPKDSDEKTAHIAKLLPNFGIDLYALIDYDVNSPPFNDMVMIYSLSNKKSPNKKKVLVLILDDFSKNGIYIPLKDELLSRHALPKNKSNIKKSNIKKSNIKKSNKKEVKRDFIVCSIDEIMYDYMVLTMQL